MRNFWLERRLRESYHHRQLPTSEDATSFHVERERPEVVRRRQRRPDSDGGVEIHRTAGFREIVGPAVVAGYRRQYHYPHSESDWLIMWISQSGDDLGYNFHEEINKISTV
jgi:hypothetical protein